MDIWFAADLHLSHRSLVEGFGDGRPGPRANFGTIEDHDEAIITSFNETVKPADKLYLLGDLALGARGFKKIALLNGRKRAVLGNHDQQRPKEYAQVFQKVFGAKVLDGMLLTHIPVHPSALTRRSMQVNVHGHTHGEWVSRLSGGFVTSGLIDPFPDPRYRCVSLEQISYQPIHIDEIKSGFGRRLEPIA